MKQGAKELKSGIPEKNGIIEGTIWKQLLLFFFPILFGAFFQQLYNTVDAIIVGRFVGANELAAVGGSTASLINLLVGFFIGLSSGATVIIAQHYGAGDKEKVSRAVHTAVALALSAGTLLMIVGLLINKTALRLMQVPDEIMPYSIDYLGIFFFGMIPNLYYNISAAILRAVGDSKRPLYILIFTCLMNVLLDLLFVVWLGMSVKGVALATVICQYISAGLTTVCLIRTDDCYKLVIRKIRFYKGYLSRIIRIGLPAGMQSLAYSSANVVIHSNINLLGSTVMAANTAYSKIDCVFWMVINAFGISVSTFVGQNYGADKMDRVKKSMWTTMGMGALFSVCLTTFMLLFGRYCLMLFTTDEEVLDIGMDILRVIAPYFITYVPVEIISGTCRAMGKVLVPMIMTLCGICAYRLIWIFFVVPNHRTLEMTMACFPISWAITGSFFMIYYFYLKKTGKWPGSKK